MPSSRRRPRAAPRHRDLRVRAAGWLLPTAILMTAGCGHSTAAQARFNDAPGPQPGCMVHQNSRLTPAYTGGGKAQTDLVLAMLAYYTAHGTEPYCDHRPPTAIDQTWARLYVQLGADPTKVTPILHPPSS